MRVIQRDGSRAVLKVAYPHLEGMFEAVGLQAFPDGLAPEVLRQDPWTWSLLLAEVTPGVPLLDQPLSTHNALTVGGTLQAALTAGSVPDILPRLAEAMALYAVSGRARLPAQADALAALGVRDLVVSALDELEELAGTGISSSLLHGDLNPGNVLRSGDAWMVVDPKPLVGDPAFDLWPLAAQLGVSSHTTDAEAHLREKIAVVSEAAGQDPSRVARWGAARTGLNVSWYLADGDQSSAETEARALRTWTAVARG